MKPFFFFLCFSSALMMADDPEMIRIPAGEFVPLWKDEEVHAVPAFLIDTHAVTNAEFLEFVRENPEWRRGEVPGIFADSGYLGHWEDDLTLGDMAPADSPVVSVSWFAARAYAESRGKRLPTLAEWEYAAALMPETERTNLILRWYAQPTPSPLPAVGSTVANEVGVWDMHGLIWEWVEDFSGIPVSSRASGTDNPDAANFCGGGALSARDLTNYAAFIRYALRAGLRGRHTVTGLGFRCAQTPPKDS